MTPDDVHDYPYQLRNAERRLERDPRVRSQDKKLIQAFMRQAKAQEVPLGRQAKYVNTLTTVAHHMWVPFRRAKRKDIEDLMTRLADHEFTKRNWDGTESRHHYSAETMADFKIMVKRFMRFVRFGDTDKDTPYPEEVRWLRKTIKASERQEPLYFTDEEVHALIRAADTTRDKALISVAPELGHAGKAAERILEFGRKPEMTPREAHRNQRLWLQATTRPPHRPQEDDPGRPRLRGGRNRNLQQAGREIPHHQPGDPRALRRPPQGRGGRRGAVG